MYLVLIHHWLEPSSRRGQQPSSAADSLGFVGDTTLAFAATPRQKPSSTESRTPYTAGPTYCGPGYTDIIAVFWCPLLPYGYSYKASCARPGRAIICNFDIRALWRSDLSVRVPGCQNYKWNCKLQTNYKWRLNPVWHKILYSCTYMATVGIKGLKHNNYITRVWNSLPAHLRDKDITYGGFRRELKTFCFNVASGAQWDFC